MGAFHILRTTLLVAADQATKYGALAAGLKYHINMGVSFGILSGSATVRYLPIVVLLFAAVWGFRHIRSAWGSLMFCGMVSNIMDRIFVGGVIDWIPVPFTDRFFAGGLMMNMADIYLCAGGLIFMASIWGPFAKQAP